MAILVIELEGGSSFQTFFNGLPAKIQNDKRLSGLFICTFFFALNRL